MASITIEQLIDIVNADLTVSGLFPKILPDLEIQRIISELALEWFYKNYQFAVMKSYFFLDKECMRSEVYTKYKYFIFPEEVENITKITKIDDPSMFRLGIQAPHLSINLGVTNQPFLTSFVTTAGELGVYRSIISGFADEINKLNKPTLKFSFNHVNKRLHLLTNVDTNIMIECFVRIESEELFDYHLFKEYIIGLCKVRMGEVIGRLNITMPGNFQYNAGDMITQGQAQVTKVEEKIKAQTTTGWFIMSR